MNLGVLQKVRVAGQPIVQENQNTDLAAPEHFAITDFRLPFSDASLSLLALTPFLNSLPRDSIYRWKDSKRRSCVAMETKELSPSHWETPCPLCCLGNNVQPNIRFYIPFTPFRCSSKHNKSKNKESIAGRNIYSVDGRIGMSRKSLVPRVSSMQLVKGL